VKMIAAFIVRALDVARAPSEGREVSEISGAGDGNRTYHVRNLQALPHHSSRIRFRSVYLIVLWASQMCQFLGSAPTK